MRDRLIAILLGIVIGVGIVTSFVFLGSEQTIDSPGVNSPRERTAPKQATARPRTGEPAVATVRVIGGAPATGPVQLGYRRGQLVRLDVVSDATVGLEVSGYGIARTVSLDKPTMIAFDASKVGNFSLMAAASHIAIARLRVRR